MPYLLTLEEQARCIIHVRAGALKATLCGLDINAANDAWEPYHIWIERCQFPSLSLPGTHCAECARIAATELEPSPA